MHVCEEDLLERREIQPTAPNPLEDSAAGINEDSSFSIDRHDVPGGATTAIRDGATAAENGDRKPRIIQGFNRLRRW
jgi:hypothetical protein